MNTTKVVMVGHVDHGKSTLVGQLLHLTGSLPEGKVESIEESCRSRGVPFEWAFVMDAFSSERDQNVTIDTAQHWMHHEDRQFVIIDAPGHREFIKNMVTGAAQADGAIVLLAANEGVAEQSKRHGYLLGMLGIKQVVVAVNKMDLVGYSQSHFDALENEYRAFLKDVGVDVSEFVAVSAKEGENITSTSDALPWSKQTLLGALKTIKPVSEAFGQALQLSVQDIYRFDDRRLIACKVEQGKLTVGDEVAIYPGGEKTKVASIEVWSAPEKTTAVAGESIAITLTNSLFTERGNVITAARAPLVSQSIATRIFWLGSNDLKTGRRVKVKVGTQAVWAQVTEVENVTDVANLEKQDRASLGKHEVADIRFELEQPLVCDSHRQSLALGRVVIVDGYDVCGGGLILSSGEPKAAGISVTDWYQLNGHFGGVLEVPENRRVCGQLQKELFALGIRSSVCDRSSASEVANSGVLALVPSQAGGRLMIYGKKSFHLTLKERIPTEIATHLRG